MNLFQKIFKRKRFSRRKLLAAFLFLVLISSFTLYFVIRAEATTICWTGAGSDALWSTGANWKGGVAPGASDIAEFDSTTDCPIGTYPNANKASTADVASVAGIKILVYTGTITQNTGTAITVGTSNYSQTAASSTFNGSANAITVNGTFTLSNGTFKASSGTTTFVQSITISGSPTFNANGGTVVFLPQPSGGATYACNNVTFNLVTINATNMTVGNTINWNADCSLPLGANPSITPPSASAHPNLTFKGTVSGTGTLTVCNSANNCNFTLDGTSAGLSGFSGFVSYNLTTAAAFILLNNATFNAGSYSTFTLSGLTINAGSTFTAPSGLITLSGQLTNSGTFNANGGTVVIKPYQAGSVYACNNATFNLVTIDLTNDSNHGIVVNADCSFPLGASPSIPGPTSAASGASIDLLGTLSGSGTLTVCTTSASACTLIMHGTLAALSGFTGLANYNSTNNSGSSFTLSNNATFNANSYSAFDIIGLTINSGSTFTAPPITMIIGAVFSNSGTFNANGGTVRFQPVAANGAFACNNAVFNLVILDMTYEASKFININADCSFPLGANPTIISPSSGTPTITLKGTLSGSGALTVCNGATFCNLTLDGTSYALSGFGQLVMNNTGGSLSLTTNANFDASSYFSSPTLFSLTINAGSTFTAPSTLIIAGNFTNSGTFNANGGTVKLNRTTTQNVGGNTTFYNLDLTSTASRQINFIAGNTFTVSNQFTAVGVSSGSKILLRSSSTLTQWNLTVNGPENVEWADIKDSNACGGRSLIDNAGTNSAGNTCWSFLTNGAKNPTRILQGVKILQGTKIKGT